MSDKGDHIEVHGDAHITGRDQIGRDSVGSDKISASRIEGAAAIGRAAGVSVTQDQTREILEALLGNQLRGEPGLLSEMREMRKRVDELEKTVSRVVDVFEQRGEMRSIGSWGIVAVTVFFLVMAMAGAITSWNLLF